MGMGLEHPSRGRPGNRSRATGARDDPSEQFEALFQRRYSAIYAYVVRRLGPSSGEWSDVVAEVFVVAWRRRGQIPQYPDDLLWLYGVARRVLSRHRRSLGRRWRLEDRLNTEMSASAYPSPASDGPTDQVREAMSRLRPMDQEVLRLVFWEQLSHREAATALGCSVNAVGLRLHKARARLRQHLGAETPRTSHLDLDMRKGD